MAGATSIILFGENKSPRQAPETVIIFGMTRGGTSMVAGAVRGFGYHLGDDLQVNQEDGDFWFKTDLHMNDAISKRNARHRYWGWKYPMAAEYLERLLPELRNPIFVIATRDPVATATSLVRWDDRDPSGAMADSILQMQKNIMLTIRLRRPTLFVSYERASLDPDLFLSELEAFLDRPMLVDRGTLRDFMVPGSYKSFDEIVRGLAD